MKITLGLEIGEQYLKMMAARMQATRSELFECFVEPIHNFSDEQITARIKEALGKWNLKPNSVALSVSRSLVTVRNLHLPSQDKEELLQMINLHIGRVVPYKKEEIIFGYQLLGTDEMGYTKVILAIIDSVKIRRQVDILEKAGLLTDRINLSSYGSWQWVLKNYRSDIKRSDLYIMLDVDSLFTDFIIFSHDNLFYTRGLFIPADASGILGEGGVLKLISEIKQSLITFNNEEASRKPVMAFLSGPVITDNLIKPIEIGLGIPAKMISPPCSQGALKSKEINIPVDVSLTGLADLTLGENARSISFLLPEIQVRKALRERTRDLFILGSLCIYFLSAVCAVFLGSIYNQQSYLKKLTQETVKIEGEMGDLLEQLSKIGFIRAFLFERRQNLFFFSKLYGFVPDTIALTFINIDEGNAIILRGQALHLADVFKLVEMIKKSKYFTDIQTKYTRTKKLKDKEVTEFELNLKAKI